MASHRTCSGNGGEKAHGRVGTGEWKMTEGEQTICSVPIVIRPRFNPLKTIKVKVMSVCLSWCQAPIWNPKTRFLLLSGSWGFVDVGRLLWREDRSVVYNSCWSSPAESFSGPINFRY
jgi:hypothetical protein